MEICSRYRELVLEINLLYNNKLEGNKETVYHKSDIEHLGCIMVWAQLSKELAEI